jgi:predicted TIM-barrel fold metal-dependent hydrolase
MRKSDPERSLASPIPFRPGSNGEFVPLPETDTDRRAEAAYRAMVDDNSRRLGVSRREFVTSTCGTAAALVVINQSYGCAGRGDPPPAYQVDKTATLEPAAACAKLRGPEFIFDVQTHHVDLRRDWSGNSIKSALEADRQGGCGAAQRIACWGAEEYVREIFVKSDTAVSCLTMLPSHTPEQRPLLTAEAAATRELVDRMARSPRMVIHGIVNPELGPPQLDEMQRVLESSRVAAWKVYTQFGAWRLDDDKVGRPFLERARALGLPRVCVHKGLAFPSAAGPPRNASPADVGPAARAFPDVALIIYHSGYEAGNPEGPYNPRGAGIDRLVRSLRDAGVGPGRNVYAELGSTWRLLMTRPLDAAHALGKLLVAVGPDNVVWGTDSLWYGTPQAQIEAFRAFEIPVELQDKYGYPALTPALKAKIFGLNAAAVYNVDPHATRCAIGEDDLARRKAENDVVPAQRLGPVGPATRREFLAHFAAHGPG